jgi:hypothetical protein
MVWEGKVWCVLIGVLGSEGGIVDDFLFSFFIVLIRFGLKRLLPTRNESAGILFGSILSLLNRLAGGGRVRNS